MWSGFRSAIEFLTIIPFGPNRDFDAGRALPFFPLCGLLIGCILMIADTIGMHLWNPMAASLLTLAAWAAASGALHLDGLADTADGLYSRRQPDEALAIMKDSRIGAMGMIAVVFCLAIKWVGLIGLEEHRLLVVLIIPAYARAAVLFGIQRLPYGRPDGGTGHSFFQTPLTRKAYWGVIGLILLSMLLGWKAVFVNLVFFITVFGMIAYYRRKIGCITGDMLGAMIEITEAALLLTASAKWSF
jgi:adenosylcobinamide-GDP ribazoletransferase